MIEPTERDREAAWEALRYAQFSEGGKQISVFDVVVKAISTAREEGRREERERCVRLIEEIFGDQDGGLAARIRSGE